jgi:hypothetical protein
MTSPRSEWVPVLKGVDSIPKNGYRLKFRILTDCDFISGTNIKVTAFASNSCGDIQSRVSYSEPIIINDLPTNNNLYVISTINSDAFYTCGREFPVKVKSDPSNAEVFIDGKSVGRTPYEGNFPLGEHRLVLQKEGYFEHAEDFSRFDCFAFLDFEFLFERVGNIV